MIPLFPHTMDLDCCLHVTLKVRPNLGFASWFIYTMYRCILMLKIEQTLSLLTSIIHIQLNVYVGIIS